MNIFRVDNDPICAAQALCDKHVVKMVLETAQIVCTVLRQCGVELQYHSTHKNHPCTIWAAQTRANFEWLISHGLALGCEYTHRYNKQHKSVAVIEQALEHTPVIVSGPETEQPMCMPDEFRTSNVVDAYRSYYKHKQSIISMKWTARNRPAWL